MGMRCENYLCLYEENGGCILREIELDVQGQCKQCIYLDIAETELQRAKAEQRNHLFLE